MRRVLKLFFELPGVLDSTLKYMEELEQHSKIIMNLVPLGSHKGAAKCGAVYLSIPVLPPSMQSKLKNIFLFTLFNTKDRVKYTNKIMFAKPIEELQFLQNQGISVTVNVNTRQIYYILALIEGDNLGLNSILGLTESFSANFFCRFCLTPHKDIHTVLNERYCILRNPENYSNLASKNNISVSGIKENCVFHEIDNFHLTNNPAIDPLHDFPDGILRYDVPMILNQLLYVEKRSTLDDLNLRLPSFQFGENDNINKPLGVSEKQIKQNFVKMTAFEMLNLFRSLFLIVGPFVPVEN